MYKVFPSELRIEFYEFLKINAFSGFFYKLAELLKKLYDVILTSSRRQRSTDRLTGQRGPRGAHQSVTGPTQSAGGLGQLSQRDPPGPLVSDPDGATWAPGQRSRWRSSGEPPATALSPELLGNRPRCSV
jgi:hypothetical protein